MSKFGKRGVRCDWCGKFANNHDGLYLKPDAKSIGHIRQPEWERNHVNAAGDHDPIDSEHDICEECEADQCPRCGSGKVVKITPMTPGPTGWGARCKACGAQWIIPVPQEA